MAKKNSRKYQWVYSPPKPEVPDQLKKEVIEKSQALVQRFKQDYVKPPPKDPKWDYIIEIYTKWHSNYFYFRATYACPGPNAISPTFGTGFARMEYVGDGKFNLAYMRHTGQFWQVDKDLTLKEALQTIQENGLYHPRG